MGSKRRITVTCNVRGRDMGSFVAEAQQKIAEQVELPSKSYYAGVGRAIRESAASPAAIDDCGSLGAGLDRRAALLDAIATLTDTLFVFASVPFACVGGMLAMWMRNLPLSISAAVGFITLSGVSVLSSMVVVSRLRAAAGTGMALRNRSCKRRPWLPADGVDDCAWWPASASFRWPSAPAWEPKSSGRWPRW